MRGLASHPQDIWPKLVIICRYLARRRAYRRAFAAGELLVEVAAPPRECLLTVATPVYRVREDHLRAAIASVRAQTHASWELILLDDASPEPHVGRVLDEATREDRRIRTISRTSNAGIAAASNEIIATARGEYVAFLDHDDLLHPRALELATRRLAAQPEADWIFSDEDKVDERGRHHQPCLKPGWSPHLLLAFNYVCHFRVIRRSLLLRVGGHRIGFDGAQDYDLALRCLAAGARFAHLPGVLYHWRTVATSMARVASAKPAAHQHALRALVEHAETWPRGGAVLAEVLLAPASFFRVRRAPGADLRLAVLTDPEGLAAGLRGSRRFAARPSQRGARRARAPQGLRDAQRASTAAPLAAAGWQQDLEALVAAARGCDADVILAPAPGGFDGDQVTELLSLLQVPGTALTAGRFMRGRRVVASGWVATDEGRLRDPWAGLRQGWRDYLNLAIVPGPRLIPTPAGWAAWRSDLLAAWDAAPDVPNAWRLPVGLALLDREIVVSPEISLQAAGARCTPPQLPAPPGLPVAWRAWLDRFGLAYRRRSQAGE
ncbi:MAG: glycosyltransferase [Acidobacteriota bacterium]